MTHRDELEAATSAVIEAFTDATNRHDIETMASLVSNDITFDGTSPPDGMLLFGRSAVREFWEALFHANPRAAVETEEIVPAGNRCTARVRYVFDTADPEAAHVRAIDLYRVDDGLITEKLSYVKG